MADSQSGAHEAPPSIQVSGLSYAFPDGSTGLQDVSLDLPARSRTLLIGGKIPFHPGLYQGKKK